MTNGGWGKQDTIKETSITIPHKPIVNYKQITQAGIFWPITKKFLAEVVIRSPEDQESQREKPVFDMRVKLYTTNYDLMSPSRVPIPKYTDLPILVL